MATPYPISFREISLNNYSENFRLTGGKLLQANFTDWNKLTNLNFDMRSAEQI